MDRGGRAGLPDHGGAGAGHAAAPATAYRARASSTTSTPPSSGSVDHGRGRDQHEPGHPAHGRWPAARGRHPLRARPRRHAWSRPAATTARTPSTIPAPCRAWSPSARSTPTAGGLVHVLRRADHGRRARGEHSQLVRPRPVRRGLGHVPGVAVRRRQRRPAEVVCPRPRHSEVDVPGVTRILRETSDRIDGAREAPQPATAWSTSPTHSSGCSPRSTSTQEIPMAPPQRHRDPDLDKANTPPAAFRLRRSNSTTLGFTPEVDERVADELSRLDELLTSRSSMAETSRRRETSSRHWSESAADPAAAQCARQRTDGSGTLLLRARRRAGPSGRTAPWPRSWTPTRCSAKARYAFDAELGDRWNELDFTQRTVLGYRGIRDLLIARAALVKQITLPTAAVNFVLTNEVDGVRVSPNTPSSARPGLGRRQAA